MDTLVNLFPNNLNPNLFDQRIWFQQDGAPPHFAKNVRNYLNEVFPKGLLEEGVLLSG